MIDRRKRGVSTVIGYVLALGLTTIIVTGLLIGVTALLETETDRAKASSFEVVGQQSAADFESFDSLVIASGGSQSFSQTASLPDSIANTQYKILVEREAGTLYRMTVTEDAGDIFAEVTFRSYTPVEETTFRGGEYELSYNQSVGKVMIDNV